MSIPDQERELLAHATQRGLHIVQILRESRSAKRRGRPIFNAMMDAIERGEASGILVWDLNRLSRNLRDAGWVGDLFVEGLIKEIATPRESYTTYNHLWSIWMQFLTANAYVVNMAKDIARGQRGSLENGFWPGAQKLGYVPFCECPNAALTGKHRRHRQVADPARGPLVREILRQLADGVPVSDVLRRAREEWHLTLPKHGRHGGGLLASGHLYRLMQDPFYAGVLQFKGQTFVGNHEPLISWEQYQRIQARLKKRNRAIPLASRAYKHLFTYRGLIRCGRCSSMVTAEYTTNRFGKRYTYYHCARKHRSRGEICPERSAQEGEIEKQLVGFLQSLELPTGVAELVLQELPVVLAQEQGRTTEAVSELEKLLADKDEELRRLARLCAQGRITEQVLQEDSEAVKKEQYDLRDKVMKAKSPRVCLEPYDRVFFLVNHAVSSFRAGDSDTKRAILAEVVSNLTLKGQKLAVQAKRPFRCCGVLARSPIVWTNRRRIRTMLRRMILEKDS